VFERIISGAGAAFIQERRVPDRGARLAPGKRSDGGESARPKEAL